MSGVPKWMKPVLPNRQVTNVVCDGDSFTAGVSGGADAQHTYPYLLGQQAGIAYGGSGTLVTNLGVGGQDIAAMIARGAATDAYFSTGYRQNILLWLAGYNNYGDISLFPQIMALVRKYLAARAAAGWTIGLFTLTDFLTRAEPNFDNARKQHNAYLRAHYVELGAAGIIDLGADPVMGAAGAGAPNFDPVTNHPTAAGNQIMANYANKFLQRQAVYL